MKVDTAVELPRTFEMTGIIISINHITHFLFSGFVKLLLFLVFKPTIKSMTDIKSYDLMCKRKQLNYNHNLMYVACRHRVFVG